MKATLVRCKDCGTVYSLETSSKCPRCLSTNVEPYAEPAIVTDNGATKSPKQPPSNWLVEGMRKTYGKDGVPQTNWLENAINKVVGFGKKTAINAYDDYQKKPKVAGTSTGLQLFEPMMEVRSCLMFVAIGLIATVIVFGYGAFVTYFNTSIITFTVGYAFYRLTVLRKLNVKKEFDSNRCAECLKNMKRIYNLQDSEVVERVPS